MSKKGYKIFRSDWTCYPDYKRQYACPGEFSVDDGIFMYKTLAECLKSGDLDINLTCHITEAEACGDVVEYNDKFRTNKLRILREISWEEAISSVNIHEFTPEEFENILMVTDKYAWKLAGRAHVNIGVFPDGEMTMFILFGNSYVRFDDDEPEPEWVCFEWSADGDLIDGEYDNFIDLFVLKYCDASPLADNLESPRDRMYWYEENEPEAFFKGYDDLITEECYLTDYCEKAAEIFDKFWE